MESFLRVMLPYGGYAVALVEMYFDESEADNHSILCVAGYLFQKEKAVLLEPKWRAILLENDLPFFRMVDCAHGNGVFSHLSNDKPKRIEIQTALFDLLKEHMECGFVYSFDLNYKHLCPNTIMNGVGLFTPYSLCCYWGLMGARYWSEQTSFDGKIAYFFEAGHSSQSQANGIMQQIFDVPELREAYRYAGHAFVNKQDSVLLQCADILAWQWGKNVKERAKGNLKARADLLSLLDKPHYTAHFDEARLIAFNEMVDKSKTIAAMRTLEILSKSSS